MRAIAVVPARGGSKRIPKKNVLMFSGKPMIAWTVEAAIDSGKFDKVLVSTDDEEIANVAREVGAEVPFLRQAATDDHSPVSIATIAALSQAESYWGHEFDLIAQLMPNCPLRTKDDIKSAFEAFERHDAQFQISAFEFGWMNPWWAARLDSKQLPQPLFTDALGRRSQDLEKLYCPTGAIWIAKASALKKSGTFYGDNHRYQPMSWDSSVDIDEWEDLKFACAVYHMRQGFTE